MNDAQWDAVVLNAADDVAVALRDLRAGERVRIKGTAGLAELAVLDDVPFGHKLARRAIASGEIVRKYGEPIGGATAAIAAGAHVHVHNITSLRGKRAS